MPVAVCRHPRDGSGDLDARRLPDCPKGPVGNAGQIPDQGAIAPCGRPLRRIAGGSPEYCSGGANGYVDISDSLTGAEWGVAIDYGGTRVTLEIATIRAGCADSPTCPARR